MAFWTGFGEKTFGREFYWNLAFTIAVVFAACSFIWAYCSQRSKGNRGATLIFGTLFRGLILLIPQLAIATFVVMEMMGAMMAASRWGFR
jgi:hypothetical protein